MTKAPNRPPRKKAKPKPTTKGFSCPTCIGHRLFVYYISRPMPGLVRRYRECSGCGHRLRTDERPSKGKPLKPNPTPRGDDEDTFEVNHKPPKQVKHYG